MRIFTLLLLSLFSVNCLGQAKSLANSKLTIKDEKGNVLTEYCIKVVDNDTILDGAYINYYPNGNIKDSCYFENGIVIGKEVFYNKNGKISFINEYIGKSFPRNIKTKAYYYSGACRYSVGNLLEIEPGLAYKHGIVKYYWKNMQVMDSVVYENDKVIYRARFNKKGILQFEKKN